MAEEKEEEKYDVRVTVSSLGNERRTIMFKEQTKEQTQGIIEAINNSFGVIRTGDSLQLIGSDGVVVFVHLKNVAFIEVHVG